jgi:hypothetical protein
MQESSKLRGHLFYLKSGVWMPRQQMQDHDITAPHPSRLASGQHIFCVASSGPRLYGGNVCCQSRHLHNVAYLMICIVRRSGPGRLWVFSCLPVVKSSPTPTHPLMMYFLWGSAFSGPIMQGEASSTNAGHLCLGDHWIWEMCKGGKRNLGTSYV